MSAETTYGGLTLEDIKEAADAINEGMERMRRICAAHKALEEAAREALRAIPFALSEIGVLDRDLEEIEDGTRRFPTARKSPDVCETLDGAHDALREALAAIDDARGGE